MKLKSPAFLAVAAVAAALLVLSTQRDASCPSCLLPSSDSAASAPTVSLPPARANQSGPATASWVRDPRQAPAWAVAFGREFWKPERAKPLTNEQEILASGLIERMSVRFSQDGSTGLPVVQGKTYKLEMDAAGFRYTADSKSFHIATQRVEIPGLPAAAEIGGWSVVGNTAQRDRFGNQSVIEHVEAEPNGASITWVLRKAPAAAKDGSIQVAVSGGATVSSGGRIQVKGKDVADWSNAVAVDASGKRTSLTSHFKGDHIVIDLPRELLASSSYPLAIDPTITSIGALDPDQTLRPAEVQLKRLINVGSTWVLLTLDGYLLYVDANGQSALPVLLPTTEFKFSDVAYTGGKFIAVGSPESDLHLLQAVTFDVTGGVAESPNIVTVFAADAGETGETVEDLTATTANNRTLVTWTTRSYESEALTEGVFGTILAADGSAVGTPFQIAPFDGDLDEQGVIAAAGSTATATWLALVRTLEGTTYTTTAKYITEAGLVTDAAATSSITAATAPVESVAWSPAGTTGWLATWTDATTTQGLRFQADGTPLGTSFQIYSQPFSFGLAGSSNGWVHMSKTGTSLFTNAITFAGAVSDTNISVSGTYTSGIAASNTTTTALFILSRGNLTGLSNRSIILNAATGAKTSGPTVLIQRPNDQRRVSVIGNSDGRVLAAWIDNVNAAYTSVVGVRIDDTTILDSTPLTFSNNAANDDHGWVATASVGSDFLVAFTRFDLLDDEDPGVVQGRLCSGAGVVSGAAAFEIGTGEEGLASSRLTAEGNGTGYLVAWIASNADFLDEIQGAPVDTAGTVGTQAVLVPGASQFLFELALASDGTDWMLLYRADIAVTPPESKLAARRIAAPGNVVGSEILVSDDLKPFGIDIAYSGTQFLALWNNFTDGDLHGRRFTTTGTLFNEDVIDEFGFNATVVAQDVGWLVGLSGFNNGIYAPRLIRVNANGAPEFVPETVKLVEGNALVANNGSAAGGFVGIHQFDSFFRPTPGARIFGATAEYLEPLITSAPDVTGQVGVAFSYTITSDTGTTYTVFGTLPPGVTANPSGAITGTPTLAGTYLLTARATNDDGFGDMSLSITIAPAAPVVPDPDRTPPVLTPGKNVVTKKKSAKIRITTGDAVLIQYRIKPPGGKPSKFKSKSVAGSTQLTIKTPTVGTYVIEIKGIDSAGNVSGIRKMKVTRKK